MTLRVIFAFMNDASDSLFQLFNISFLLENTVSLDDNLQDVVLLMAKILEARRCSIMLLIDKENTDSVDPHLQVFTHHGNLPEVAYREMKGLNEGIGGYVVKTGQSLLIQNIDESSFAEQGCYPPDANKSLMSVPIKVGKTVIGVINVNFPDEKPYFEPQDLKILELFALFIGKSLYISQMETILRSKFIERAFVRDFQEQDVQENLVINPNPTRLAKIVAKSFFRELTQAGFSANQIIEIATEVLNLLQNNLNKHRQRLTRDEEVNG